VTDSFGEVQAMLAGLAREKVGASDAVEDVGDFDQNVAGVAVGLLEVAGELGAEVADPARGKAGGERERCGFGGNQFLAIVADGVVGDGAGGIEENVVGAPVTRGVEAQCELMVGSEIDVELGVGRVADLRGGIFSGEGGEMGGGVEDQGLIGGFVVSGSVGPGGGGHDLRSAIEELDDVGRVEDVLIESSEEENLVALERAADGASELLLAIVRLESEESVGGAEGTVAQVVEDGAMDVIGAGLGDDVDDGAAGASLFGAVGVGGDHS
jgi:hypothetical protein